MRLLITSFVLFLCLVGCSGKGVENQARILGSKEFTVEGWAVATQEQRGEMVGSFLAKHKVTELTAKEVSGLLGPPTGYYEYDENLAYFVGPASIESDYGKGYLFAFVTDKNNGRVIKVVLVPRVSK